MIWEWIFTIAYPKIADLVKLVFESKDYDDDFVKVWLEIIAAERIEISWDREYIKKK